MEKKKVFSEIKKEFNNEVIHKFYELSKKCYSPVLKDIKVLYHVAEIIYKFLLVVQGLIPWTHREGC